MRIALLAMSFLPRRGGMEFVVDGLADALTRGGHDVTLFAPRLRRGETEIERSYHLVRFGTRLRGAYRWGLNQWFLRRAFGSRHGDRAFDVLNVHSADLATTYALRAARGRGVPVVTTCHGHDVQRDPDIGYGARLDPVADRRIRRNLARVDRVVAISETMHAELCDLVASARIARIPNGVEIPSDAEIRSLGPPPWSDAEGPVILMVGRNHPKKRFEVAVRALPRIVASHPTARLVHVGRDGAGLSALAREVGVGDSFCALGERAREEVRAAYRAATAFVLPSSVESFGLVTIEAMAFGLPCVVTDAPGSRELVIDRESGRIVGVDDERGLAAAITELLGHDRLRRAYGRAARRRARSRYGWEAVAGRYAELFRSLACGEGGARS